MTSVMSAGAMSNESASHAPIVNHINVSTTDVWYNAPSMPSKIPQTATSLTDSIMSPKILQIESPALTSNSTKII